MPGPKRYTVRDPDSGRTVTFAWSGDAAPTDDDIAEVFAAAPQGEAPLTRERAPAPTGQIERGNIDLRARPTVKNADGSISTVRSLGVNLDGREVLIPTVTDDGRVVSDEEAIDLYRRTGKHLGKFDTPEHATAYAESLHNDQARQYGGGPDHHPDIARELARDQVSPFSALLGEAGETFGRTANDNLPALASAATALVPGAGVPMMAGAGAAGAAARQGIRRAAGEGSPMTGEELGLDVLKEGAISGALAGGPRLAMGAARTVGPAVARNAVPIGRTIQGLSSGGFGGAVMAGNLPAMLTTGAAAIGSNPRIIRGVGNVVSRVGSSPMLNTVAERLGLGVNTMRAGGDAFRKALLDALGAEPSASTDR